MQTRTRWSWLGAALIAGALTGCGDCGGGGDKDAATGSDAARHDSATASDSAGHDNYQPPTDAAGHDAAQTDAASCANPTCLGTCCQASAACSLLDGQCCLPNCTNKECGDDGCGGWCGNCTNQMCDGTGHCVAIVAPTNDACGGTIPLTFDNNGEVLVQGDTTGASGDNSVYSCGGAGGAEYPGGNDVVYSFTIEADMVVDLTLNLPTGKRALLSVKSVCQSSTAADEKTCRLAEFDVPGNRVSANLVGLDTGTYYIWVDSALAGGGPFALYVAKWPIPANDTCAAPVALDVSSGHASGSGNTGDARDDYTGLSPCSASGPDLVYSFTLTQALQVVAQLTGGSGTIYIRSACESTQNADQKACATGSTLTVPRLDPGTYYLFVDGGRGSRFTLDLTTTALSSLPDNCASAQPINFDSTGNVHLTGDASQASDDTAPVGCMAPGAGRDLVYSFHLDAPRNMWFRSNFTQFYVRDVCDSTAQVNQLGCAAMMDFAELMLRRVPAGDYWLWVDWATAGSGGPFDITINSRVPPANDDCSAPEQLTFNGSGVATAHGDSRGAAADYQGTCITATSVPEVVYQFTLDAEKLVTVTSTQVGNWLPGFYIRSVCASSAAGDEKACNVSYPTPSISARLPLGTYFLFVEGGDLNLGVFDLTVTLAN